MDEQRIFSSHSLEHLAEALAEHLSTYSLFARPLIVTPSTAIKEWLQLELCKRSPTKAILGLEFVNWQRALHLLGGQIPHRIEWLAALWQAVQEPACERRRLKRVEELTDLFVNYSLLGPPAQSEHRPLFERILKENTWQSTHDVLERTSPRSERPLALFAIDFLPPAVLQFFFRAPRTTYFRFSPCSMFFEDVRSERERRRLCGQLDELLRSDHPLLANWSRLSRRMLKVEPDVVSDENYHLEGSSTLCDLQRSLLDLEPYASSPDSSFRVLQTGPSRLREVEILRDEILKLRASGILFHEMRLYAPKIELYAPLLETVFGDEIPLRIARRDLAQQSPFGQALLACLRLVESRWEATEVAELLECKAIQQKAGWTEDDIALFKKWICQAGILWGLRENFGPHGTWEEGLGRLESAEIWLDPASSWQIPWSASEKLAEFRTFFEKLREMLSDFQHERTLGQWASALEMLVEQFIWVDETERSMQKAFERSMQQLRSCPDVQLPFIAVESLLELEQVEESSPLHAIRCASLTPSSLLPAKALFLIGMDEESFPRPTRGETHGPTPGEWDRHLMLQAIFAAKERLVISYGHLSKEDGKPVGPSILVQELIDYIGVRPELAPQRNIPTASSSFTMNVPSSPLPRLVTLSKLSRFFRSPMRWALEESLGLKLLEAPEDPWDEFAFSEIKALQAPVELPPGLFGEEAAGRLAAKQETMRQWGFEPEMIELTETGSRPPIQLPNALIVGEVRWTAPEGVLHLGDDTIEGVARNWPELLAGLVARKAHRIHCVKTGRVREVVNPESALEGVVELFLHAHEHALSFHPEWADDLLRHQRLPEEPPRDPALQWAWARNPELKVVVKPEVERCLAPLAALFPKRGAHAEV